MKHVDRVVYKSLKQHLWGITSIILLMIGAACLEALAPWPFKLLIDNILGNEPFNKTVLGTFLGWINSKELLGYLVVFLFFSISILLSLLDYAKSYLTKQVSRSLIYVFSSHAFRNLQSFSLSFFGQQDIGDYIYRLSYDTSAIGTLLEEGLIPLITSAAYLLITTFIMFHISVTLTISALIALPFMAFGLYYFNGRIVRMSKRSEQWNSTVFAFVQQILTQLKIIQAYTHEQTEADGFDNRMKMSLNTDVRLYKLNFLLSLVIGIIIAISYSFIIGYGINSVFSGSLTTGLLIVFIFYLDNLTNPVLSIIYAVSSLKENKIRIERMNEFFDTRNQTTDTGILPIIQQAEITFDNVSLVGGLDVPILHHASFQLPSGSLTVLVGVSGSGKSSILSLIPRFFEPTSGRILIDGQDIKHYNLHSLRNQISYVPQEPLLFNNTIRHNIAYGNELASYHEIQKAAKLAMADQFIERRPNRYDYKVGDSGNYLSGGQRQRILLARAFLKPSRIALFDEPLSLLDIQNRHHIWQNLKQYTKGKTTIVISNILDVITEADFIIVVNDGKVVSIGKHHDLLKQSDLYRLILRDGG